MAKNIQLKEDINVKICVGNYDIQDGLVNGVDGKFKAYSKDTDPDIIWLQFNDPCIGRSQASQLTNLNQTYINNGWVPILRLARPLQKQNTMYKMTIRKQFPIQLACARTIHRAQGLTMHGLAFDPLGVHHHGLTYTALSRTTTIDSLF